MQASRLFFATAAAAGLFGLSGLALAQTTPSTSPGTTNPATSSTTNTNETDAQRMNRERMERERLERERAAGTTGTTGSDMDRNNLNRPGLSNDRTGTSGSNEANRWSNDPRRDANGNLRARADRN